MNQTRRAGCHLKRVQALVLVPLTPKTSSFPRPLHQGLNHNNITIDFWLELIIADSVASTLLCMHKASITSVRLSCMARVEGCELWEQSMKYDTADSTTEQVLVMHLRQDYPNAVQFQLS